MTMQADTPDRLPVLLPFRPRGNEGNRWLGAGYGTLLCVGLTLLVSTASAQAGRAMPSSMDVIAKWAPLLLTGFAFNILISALAMLLGTISGLGVGLGLLSEWYAVRQVSWALTQIFRNAPWLVLLFFVMFLVPFQVTVFGLRIPFPDWIKATVGFALPVMANVAEVVRGAVKSLPSTQWEAAEALAFTRRQTMWRIILPQCVKRMLPPWMNIYSLVTMSTALASIVGVSEMLTLTAQVHAAEGGRPELFAPLYGFALLCFFLYCYPINLWTTYLERCFQTG